MSKQFKTTYGYAGGDEYGGKKKGDFSKSRFKKALDKKMETGKMVPGGTGRIHPLQKMLMEKNKK